MQQSIQPRPTMIGTSIVKPRPQKQVNDYWARYAEVADAREMTRLLREVFPDFSNPVSYVRDIQRPDIAHILAVRKLTDQEHVAAQNQNSGLLQSITSKLPIPWLNSNGPSTSQYDERIAGMVSIWIVLDQAHITAIATSPHERRRGIGGLLMVLAINEAIDRGAEVATLEVRKSNQRAQALYRRFGFTETGVRHKYYSDNKEDALIMSTPNMHLTSFRRLFQRQVDEHIKINGVTAFVND